MKRNFLRAIQIRNKREKVVGKRKVKLLRVDPFGNLVFLKRMLIGMIGTLSYRRMNIINKLELEGTDFLKDLPDRNVMFVSNHQTYYADVIALYHVFCSVKWNFKDSIDLPIYVLAAKANVYYIAAEETMKDSGWLPKVFSYTGAVTVKRSWRSKGKEISGNSDLSAPDKIKKALGYGWVINFPQGTTKAYAPVRKGTASMIKSLNPIVVPVVLEGFDEAFDKKGLVMTNKGTKLKIRFKAPLEYDADDSVDDLVKKITVAIEQVKPEDNSNS